jgi:hypothetical protein
MDQSQMGHDTVPPETAPEARSLSRRSHNGFSYLPGLVIRLNAVGELAMETLTTA